MSFTERNPASCPVEYAANLVWISPRRIASRLNFTNAGPGSNVDNAVSNFEMIGRSVYCAN